MIRPSTTFLLSLCLISLGLTGTVSVADVPGTIEPQPRPIKHCDCNADGTACGSPMPSSCTDSGQCSGCSYMLVGEQCNDPDDFDALACVPLASQPCQPKFIGSCLDGNCVAPQILFGTACDGGNTVKQCKN